MRLLLFYSIFFFFSQQVVAGSLPDLIEKTKRSIVAVGTYMPKRSPKGLFLGTGFAVADGTLIVTNAHVVSAKNTAENDFEKLAIFSRKNDVIKMLAVRIVAIDKIHDIAILKLVSGRFPPLKIDLKAIREGESIVFTGYPIGMVLGLFPVTHRGIVSAISPVVIPMMKSRQLSASLLKKLRDPYEVYQLDATAYPGNSGSPVYKEKSGEVIAIINKVFIKESKETVLSKPSGITYAIPIKHLLVLLQKFNLI